MCSSGRQQTGTLWPRPLSGDPLVEEVQLIRSHAGLVIGILLGIAAQVLEGCAVTGAVEAEIRGALMVTSGAVLAQEGDVGNGQRLAQEFCSRCHDISADGAWKLHPPSFASLARFRSLDQIVARIWFPPTHSKMPQITNMLRPEVVVDLAAFISSLDRLD